MDPVVVRENRHIGVDIIKGAIAGAAATWFMGQVTTWMYEHEDRQAREREDRARGGVPAYERAAEKAADLADVRLSKKARSQVGNGIHWATGIAAGVAYAVLRRQWRGAASGKGLPFGTAFFLTVDELMNPLLGFTPGPQAFPWQAHARGFGGHLAFGPTSELILEGLDRVA
jgi:hypothetical protein